MFQLFLFLNMLMKIPSYSFSSFLIIFFLSFWLYCKEDLKREVNHSRNESKNHQKDGVVHNARR